MQLLLKINAYFSQFYCNKNLLWLWVFSSFRTGAGLRLKKYRAEWSAGRVQVRSMQVQAKYLKLLWVRTQNFNPRRTLVGTHRQLMNDIHNGVWSEHTETSFAFICGAHNTDDNQKL